MATPLNRRAFVRILTASAVAGTVAVASASPWPGVESGEARVATILRRHFGAAAAPADVARRHFRSLAAGHGHTENASYFQRALATPALAADLERYVLQEFVIRSDVLT